MVTIVPRHAMDGKPARKVDRPLSVDLEPDADPPKVLVIGPDSAGNLLEVIVLVLADAEMIAIHAMKLRRRFYELLPREEGSP